MKDFVFKTKFKDIRFVSKCQKIDAPFNASVFLFVKEGSVQLSINGVSLSAEKNQLIFIKKCEVASIKASENIECYIAEFSLQATACLSEYLKSCKNVFKADFFNGCQEHFSSMLNIFRNKEKYMHIKLNSYLNIIFAELLSVMDFEIGKADNPFDLIKDYIDANFDDKLSLETLCKVAYLSKFYLCRGFVERFNVTIQNYIVSVRIKKAKALLSESELLIKEIAYLVGFDDEMYFSRVFKKIENISPKEYRAIYSK